MVTIRMLRQHAEAITNPIIRSLKENHDHEVYEGLKDIALSCGMVHFEGQFEDWLERQFSYLD